jgi:cell wall-associated NlpC family hydrolase
MHDALPQRRRTRLAMLAGAAAMGAALIGAPAEAAGTTTPAPMGKTVSRADARPGDLVILRDSAGRVRHVGVYAGGDTMYDAPTAGHATGNHRIPSTHVEFRRVL